MSATDRLIAQFEQSGTTSTSTTALTDFPKRPHDTELASWRLRAATTTSDLGLLRNLQCVIDLDAEISHGAFQFGMAKQELYGPQVLGSLTYQRRLGPPHAIGTVRR